MTTVSGSSCIDKHQRARRIDANAPHAGRIDACQLNGLARAGDDRVPDVLARLLRDIPRIEIERDVTFGRSEHVPGGVEHTGPGAPGADIDTNKVVGHG